MVKPYDKDLTDCFTEEMLIADYCNGGFCEEPECFEATEITVPITKYANENDKPVYVHKNVVPAYEHAREYAKIYNECRGNYDVIAQRLEDEMLAMSEEEDN